MHYYLLWPNTSKVNLTILFSHLLLTFFFAIINYPYPYPYPYPYIYIYIYVNVC